MSLSADKSRLDSLTRELARTWHQAKDAWRDEKAHEFEQKYLEEIFAGVKTTIIKIEKLDSVLAKVRSDCE